MTTANETIKKEIICEEKSGFDNLITGLGNIIKAGGLIASFTLGSYFIFSIFTGATIAIGTLTLTPLAKMVLGVLLMLPDLCYRECGRLKIK